MATTAPLTTTISTKGQVVLPNAVRKSQNWRPGAKLTVEVSGDSVILKAVPVFPRTEMKDVFGSLKYDGPPISIEQMNEAVLEEARRRHERIR